MPEPSAAVYVPEERLIASPAASVEVAAAAYDAQQRAGLARADFVIIAVPPGVASADLVDEATALGRRATASSRRRRP